MEEEEDNAYASSLVPIAQVGLKGDEAVGCPSSGMRTIMLSSKTAAT